MSDPQLDSQSPPPSAPVGEARPLIGWVSLFALFALLISMALAAQFQQSSTNDDVLTRLDTQLRTAVRLTEMPRQLAPNMRSNNADLRALIRQADAEKAKDERFVGLATVMRYESKLEIPKADLEKMRASKRTSLRAMARLYGAEKLDSKQAEAIQRDLKGDAWSLQLASVHADEKAGAKNARQRLQRPGDAARLLALVGGFVLVGGLLIPGVYLAFLMARLQGKLVPVGHPSARLDAATADRYARRMVVILLAFLGVQLVAVPLLQPVLDERFLQVVLFALVATIVVALVTVPQLAGGIDAKRIGLTFDNFGKNVLWGIAGAIANIPIFLALGLIMTQLARFFPMPQHPVVQDAMNSGPLAILAILLMAAFLVPVWEEIAFRGLLFPALSNLLKSPVTGALLGAFLFAAIHPTGIPSWGALMSVALMASYLTHQTGSLIPAIVLHMVHNGTLLVIATLIT